jgi:hypothetical protein
MWKLGLRPRYSFSGNIFFKLSAFFLCSVRLTHYSDMWWTCGALMFLLESKRLWGGGGGKPSGPLLLFEYSMEGWIQREMKSGSGREEGYSAHVGSVSDCHRDRGLSQIPHCMDFDSRKGKHSGLNELCLMNCHKRL